MKLSALLKHFILATILASSLGFAAEQPATVNINTANADTIAAVLNGVGAVRAQSIVKWREQHGPFTSMAQLAEVRGVGAVVLEKNKDRIVLE